MQVTKTGGHLLDDRGYDVTPLSFAKYKDQINSFPEGSKITINNYWDSWDIDTHQATVLKGNCLTFTVEDNDALKGDKTSPLETVEPETTLNYTNNEEGVVIGNDGDSESN